MGCASSIAKDARADDRAQGASAVDQSSPAPRKDAVEGQKQKPARATLGESVTSTDSCAASSAGNVNTDSTSQTSSNDQAPGNVTVSFQMNGKTIRIPVGEERLDLSEEPDFEPPPKPPCEMEQARVKALEDLGLDYQSQEPSLDHITRICGNIYPGTLAFINFIGPETTYIKSSWPPMEQNDPIDIRISVEAWMLLSLEPEMLVVEDFTKDRRFRKSPIVMGTPFFRSLACVPLLSSDGHRIASFGIIGFAPMKVSGEMRQMLANMANMASKELNLLSERHRKNKSLSLEVPKADTQGNHLSSYVNASKECIMLLDMDQPGWKILHGNQKWKQATGVAMDPMNPASFWDIFQLAKQQGLGSATGDAIHFAAAIQARRTFEAVLVAKNGHSDQDLIICFKPATSEWLDSGVPHVKIPAAGCPGKTSEEPAFYFAILLYHRPHKLSSQGSQGSSKLDEALAEAQEPPIAGVKLGPLLGKGSSGTCYIGRWWGEKVAVKVIRKELTKEEAAVEGKHMEVMLGQQLSHPNIVKTLDSGSMQIKIPRVRSRHRRSRSTGPDPEDDCEPPQTRDLMETWIILELCSEGSLQEAIDRADYKAVKAAHWVPDVQKSVQTAAEIASAMAYLHSCDILHSDLSSNNILLSRHVEDETRIVSKVSDFGLSRVHAGHRTIATETHGTVTHMPPELLLDNRLSKAADVYAFGVIMWELHTGERPWAGLRHATIVAQKIRGRSKDQLQWPAGSNKTIKAIAQHCMQKDPHGRPTFSKVVEMLSVLQPKQLLQQK